MWEKVSVKCLETKINIQHSAQMESLFFLCCRLINGKSKYNRGKNDIHADGLLHGSARKSPFGNSLAKTEH